MLIEDESDLPLNVVNHSRKRGLHWRFLRNIQCGIHSGFKPCCIAFFSLVAEPLYELKRFELARKIRERLVPRKLNKGYIPCPLCIYRGSFVKPKKCPSSIHIDGDDNLSKCTFTMGTSEYKLGKDNILEYIGEIKK